MAGPYDAQFSDIRERIRFYAQRYGIDADLAIWQIWQESKFNPRAVSPAGAEGIAQFMPGTATRFNVNPWDIDSSLEGYGKYMSYLTRFFGGDTTKAVAAYNAGEGNIQKGIYPSETKGYLASISAGLKSIGKSILFGPTITTGALLGGVPTGIGDVLGIGALKGYFFDEEIMSGQEKFRPFLKSNLINPQTRTLLATAIVVIVVAFAWNRL